MHVGAGQSAGFGDTGHEQLVEVVDPGLQRLPLVVGEAALGIEEVRALAALDGHEVQPQLAEQLAGIEVTDEHADGTGDGGGTGEDGVGAGRHVVAARGGDVAHARDHRLLLLLPRPHQLAPDQVGGGAVATRGVDANHDRRDRRVVGSVADAADDRVRSRHPDGAERIAATFTARDVAFHAHDGDSPAATPAQVALRRLVGADLLQGDVRSQNLTCLLLELVGIDQPVDQPRLHRFPGLQDALVEEGLDLAFVEMTRIRDAPDVPSVKIVQE